MSVCVQYDDDGSRKWKPQLANVIFELIIFMFVWVCGLTVSAETQSFQIYLSFTHINKGCFWRASNLLFFKENAQKLIFYLANDFIFGLNPKLILCFKMIFAMVLALNTELKFSPFFVTKFIWFLFGFH